MSAETAPPAVVEATAAVAALQVNGNGNVPDGAKSDSDSDGEAVAADGANTSSSKKKKKKKPKKKKKVDYAENGGGVPPEVVPSSEETDEDKAKWAKELQHHARTYQLDPWLLAERERPKLNIFRTPACAGFALRTQRLVLRQVEVGDTTAIRKIKLEPVVQRTQLYGAPSASDIKDSFQRRYVTSSMPGLTRQTAWRDEYVFAITAKDPSAIKVAPAGSVKISNRITAAEGYLGNFALSLETASEEPDAELAPMPDTVWVHPSSEACQRAGLVGKMFYELHPQLWGQGIVSEAFAEILRFAFEEVGCVSVSADPTAGNDASIRLCTKHGMKFERESTENALGKPQLFHSMTRAEWFNKFRPGQPISDPWGGKETCRWCTDFRRRPVFSCDFCSWAKYCSRECQRADWVLHGGHQHECEPCGHHH